MRRKINKISVAITALFLIAFIIIIPTVSNRYYMTVLNSALSYAIAVFGLSLVMGMGGMMSFATVSFMGIGAYATANISINLGLPGYLSLPAAVIISTVVAFLIGLLLLKLKNAYFSFATIGIVQVFYAIFLNYKPLTGGPNGLPNIPDLDLGFTTVSSLQDWFYTLIIFAIIVALIVERIRRTSLGRSLAAIRDSEVVAMTQGINVYRTKLIAFMISGAFGGLSGALIAHMNSYLSAYLFTFDLSVRFLVMVMLGGINSTVGSFIGTIFVTLIPEWFRGLQSYMKLIYGVAIILMMVFMPMGLAGIIQQVTLKIKNSSLFRNWRVKKNV